MGEHQSPRAAGAIEAAGGLDPITGLGRGAAALVIGRSAAERESVARALHRAHRGVDGTFLKVHAGQEEEVLQQAIESWLAGSAVGESPRLLNRLEDGTLFLDEIGAMGLATQKLLIEFLSRADEGPVEATAGVRPASQPWKGQLVTGSEAALQGAVKAGRFDENLALRLERVRIILDPELSGSDR